MSARPAYLPIADHGVIGDLRTVALVGVDGTIDWYCPQRFDAPSVFASILDARRGGFYRIAPVGDATGSGSSAGSSASVARSVSDSRLYVEERGHSGEALGNLRQPFTHLALISAAVNLDRKLG